MTVLPPDAFFYSLSSGGRQIGIASITIDTLGDGVRITERLGLDLPIRQTSSRTQFTSIYTVGNDLRLREFRLVLPGESPMVQHVSRESDSVLVLSLGSGEPRRRTRVDPATLVPPILAPVAVARQQKLRPGERVELRSFDPVTLRDLPLEIFVMKDSTFHVPDSAEFDAAAGAWVPVHADTVAAWLLQIMRPGEVLFLWVDSRGLPIRIVGRAGIEWDRSAFEIVNTNYHARRGTGSGPDSARVIMPRSPAPATLKRQPVRQYVQLRVNSAVWSWRRAVDTAFSPGASRRGDTIRIERLPVEAASWSLPAPDSVAPEWREDSPLLAMDDSLVAVTAARIRAGVTSPVELVRRLARWTADSLAWEPQVATASAAQVLRTRRGDADGHTLALVALARAAGVPARPVGGLLLADGRWYFHSWAEVFLDHWTPVDPSLGQFPADASHLRLGIALLSRPLELLPLAASLQIEVDSVLP